MVGKGNSEVKRVERKMRTKTGCVKKKAERAIPWSTTPQKLVHNRIVAPGPAAQRPQSDRLANRVER
ncbi:hypothetical protein PG990_002584 [Apiospora arundinis]